VRKRHAMEAHVCLFMIHSTTLLLAQKIGRWMNTELERIWKEAVWVESDVPSWKFPGGIWGEPCNDLVMTAGMHPRSERGTSIIRRTANYSTDMLDKKYGDVNVKLRAIYISVLHTGRWSVSRSGLLTLCVIWVDLKPQQTKKRIKEMSLSGFESRSSFTYQRTSLLWAVV
jgi:hypothetical protein